MIASSDASDACISSMRLLIHSSYYIMSRCSTLIILHDTIGTGIGTQPSEANSDACVAVRCVGVDGRRLRDQGSYGDLAIISPTKNSEKPLYFQKCPCQRGEIQGFFWNFKVFVSEIIVGEIIVGSPHERWLT